MAGLEHRDHLGHHEHQQERDDDEAHDREHDRVEQRRQDLLADLLAALGVLGEPLEHVVQVPGLLAGGYGGAVDLGEDPREFGEAGRECVTLHDLGAHPEHDRLHAGLLGLLRYRQQPLLER